MKTNSETETWKKTVKILSKIKLLSSVSKSFTKWKQYNKAARQWRSQTKKVGGQKKIFFRWWAVKSYNIHAWDPLPYT